MNSPLDIHRSIRASALQALMVHPTSLSLIRYAVLLSLSVVVATVGLLQDSVAVVIGAMLIAPLMAPIMGVAASLVMSWGRRLLTGAAIVTVSVAVAVAIAWVISRFLPEADTGLPTEVLARTSPDVRDLLIALAAGTAGAYATVRRDVSGALPGVAVAVALVPPLACVGVLVARDQPDLAGGAELLFATNLFGIILAATVVFMVTGFVPADHAHPGRHRLLLTLTVAALPTLAIGAVLTTRFLGTVDHARQLTLATQTTVAWLGGADDLNRMSLSGSTVQVNIAGKKAPPPVAPLTESLSSALGHPTTVDVRWTPVHDDTPAPKPLPLDKVYPLVQQWLTSQSLTLDGLTYNTASLTVAASGNHPPENSDSLRALIEKTFITAPPISLTWTHTAPKAITPTDTAAATARTTTNAWAADHPGTTVLAIDQTDATTTVSLTTAVKPTTDDLQAQLRAALPQMTITIQWIPSDTLNYSTPSPTTTPAAPSPPSTAPVPPGK
ncbi:MAG: DUF389 domain-containing protein [Actinomycetota bacterium]|nr:DUF389 domain-containing protein [Actinomycetota bacterium]